MSNKTANKSLSWALSILNTQKHSSGLYEDSILIIHLFLWNQKLIYTAKQLNKNSQIWNLQHFQ